MDHDDITQITSLMAHFSNHSEYKGDWNISILGNWSISKSKNLDFMVMSVASTILGVIILTTVIGNIFVIMAVLLEKNLQNVQNYLIVSLAVADLMVACLVMPMGAVYEINHQWLLGPELCDMWTSCDVLCCTASILHLLAIAIDRYLAVTRVEYIHTRSAKKIGLMIVAVWVMAFSVSLGPLFGWKDPEFLKRITVQKRCLISQDVSYQAFATLATFYLPLAAILILYWKIFQVARKRIRRKVGKGISLRLEKKPNKKRDEVQRRNAVMERSASSGEAAAYNNGTANRQQSPSSDVSRLAILTQYENKKTRKNKKESLESKREKKAAKTLAIVTGVFVVCWLPFFVTAILMPLCKTCHLNDYMIGTFLWLGYINSTLNPIIYTIFSPDFRTAFKRILCVKASSACSLK